MAALKLSASSAGGKPPRPDRWREGRHLLNPDLGTLGRRGAVVLAGRIAAVAAQYVLFLVLARAYGARGTGLFGLAFSVSMVAAALARVGLDHGAVQAVAAGRARAAESAPHGRRRDAASAAAGPVLLAALLFGAAVGAALFLASGALAAVFDETALLSELPVAAGGLPFLTVLWVAAGLLQGAHRVGVAVWVRDVAQPVLMTAGVAGLAAIPGLRGLPFAIVIAGAAAITGTALALLCWREFELSFSSLGGLTREPFRSVLLFSLPLTLVALVNAGAQWMDRLLVGFFLPTGDLGVYDAAARLARIAAVSLVAAGSVFAPLAAGLGTRRDRHALEGVYQLTARWALLLSLPVATLLLVRPAPVLALFGPEFTGAGATLRVLVAGHLVNVLTGPCGFLLMMTGHQRREVRYTALTAGLGVALGAWLIPRYGTIGAAIATSVAIGGMNVARALQGRRLLGVQPLSGGMGRAAAAACVAGLATALLPVPADLPLLIVVAEQAALVVLLYLASLRVLGVEAEDRRLIASLLPPRSEKGRASGDGTEITVEEGGDVW